MSESNDQPPSSPVWARPGTVAAAVLVLAVLAVAGAFGLGVFDNDEAPAPEATGQATSPAPAADDDGGQPLTAAPEDATWEVSTGGVLLPVSEAHGPTDVDASGVPTGFARTPEGALMATVQIVARSQAPFDAASRRAVLESGFAPGPDRDALLAEVTEAPPTSTADLAVVAGFAMHAYNPAETVVELVMDAGQGRYISFMTTLAWDEATGSWLVAPPSGGDWSITARQLPSLDGVIAWGP